MKNQHFDDLIENLHDLKFKSEKDIYLFMQKYGKTKGSMSELTLSMGPLAHARLRLDGGFATWVTGTHDVNKKANICKRAKRASGQRSCPVSAKLTRLDFTKGFV